MHIINLFFSFFNFITEFHVSLTTDSEESNTKLPLKLSTNALKSLTAEVSGIVLSFF